LELSFQLRIEQPGAVSALPKVGLGMWPLFRQRLRDWYILLIGICLILPGLLLAAHETSPSQTASDSPPPRSQQESRSGNEQSPRPTAVQNDAPAQSPSEPKTVTKKAGPAAPPAPRSTPQPAQHQMQQTATNETKATTQAAATMDVNGDPAAGRQVFRKCQACHSLDPGKAMLGPSLAGIMGRKAGSLPNYNYSTAMKQANISWDVKKLDVSRRSAKSRSRQQDAFPRS
jgi:nitrite reductase (NO-forming)